MGYVFRLLRTVPRGLHVFLLVLVFAAGASIHAKLEAQQTAKPSPSPSSQQTNPPSSQPGVQTSQPQTPISPTKIAVQTNLVTVATTVRDKKSQIISNLTKDDFQIDEDGRPQAIIYFAREKDLPLNVGLLVDTSMSQRRVLGDERTASATFVDRVLRADMKDQAFLIHFDREVELLQDLTTSQKKLDDALNLLETPELERASEGGDKSYHGGGTLLYDAVFLASDELMRKQQGRKALIVLSDGVDRGSKESLQNAIDAAQRANTVVYSILFKSDEPYDGGYGGHHVGWGGTGGPGMGGHRYPQQREQRPDGKKILDRISKETGGRLFEVSKKQPVDQIYAQIEQELRDQYILGYVPDKSSTSDDYHKIQVSTKQKDLTVQAREGYYSQPAPAPVSGH
ncbi:MAG TPA: VWA domain-containing protein [Candidatus Cybelea sp.]|nr:VWA domain-containing protein [Candidatus Cybelea sp.]